MAASPHEVESIWPWGSALQGGQILALLLLPCLPTQHPHQPILPPHHPNSPNISRSPRWHQGRALGFYDLVQLVFLCLLSVNAMWSTGFHSIPAVATSSLPLRPFFLWNWKPKWALSRLTSFPQIIFVTETEKKLIQSVRKHSLGS